MEKRNKNTALWQLVLLVLWVIIVFWICHRCTDPAKDFHDNEDQKEQIL